MSTATARRANGYGSVEYRKGRKNPYGAKVKIDTYVTDSGKVQVKYKSIGTFKTRFEAEYALQRYIDNPYEYATSEIKTFSDLYKAWSKEYFENISPSAVRSVECAYRYCSLLYDMPIKKIGAGHIKDVMNYGTWTVKEGKYKGEVRKTSKCTQERIKSMCNLMFDYAYERRLIDFNPARSFKIGRLLKEIENGRKIKKIFEPKQVKALREVVYDIPFADMVLIALYTGFRPQELALLKVDEVYLDEGYIVSGMKTDNGRDRIVPIHPLIMPLIQRRYDESCKLYGGDRLFNDPKGQNGHKLTYDRYRRKFEFVMATMHWKGYSPHCTRHTFATQAKHSGMDEGMRKRIMGHSLKADVTEFYYVHPTLDDYIREMNKLEY